LQWPDGRRAFASNSVIVSASSPDAPPQLSDPRRVAGGGFSFMLIGAPQATYVIQASTNMLNWVAVSTNQLPPSGVMQITDSQAGTISRRYYRAMKAP
jgi:hypothetical protein